MIKFRRFWNIKALVMNKQYIIPKDYEINMKKNWNLRKIFELSYLKEIYTYYNTSFMKANIYKRIILIFFFFFFFFRISFINS